MWLKKFSKVIFLLCFTLLQAAHADSLTITTDRQNIEQGDVISLYVDADFQTLGNTLDYSALDADFQVLSRQRSNSYVITNGQQKAQTRWHLRLLPKKVGTLTVPPLKLGDIQSLPYDITVTKSKPAPAGTTPAFFMQAELNKAQVYLQEETLYSLRFYHQGKLISGNIRPPHFGNALVDNLKEENIYDKFIDGKYYTVYEWIYVLYPQSSGELTIQAPEFNGLIQLDQKQKAVQERAQSLSLQVLPVPDNFPEPQKWLPAKSVFLKQEWRNLPDKIRVGDSLTRVITLQVFGQKANQLPTLETPAGDNYKTYQQQPLTQEEKLNDGVLSQIEIIQSIVPTKEGTLVLPEQEIHWWNTQNQHMETLYLESRSVEVLAGMQQPDYQRLAEATPESTAENPPENREQPALFWQWLSLVLGVSLLIALFALWKMRRALQHSATAAHHQTPSDSKRQINVDWCELPAEKFYQALSQYARDELNCHLLALALNAEEKALLQALEKHLFAQGDWQSQQQFALCQAVQALPVQGSKTKTKYNPKTELNKLYGA